MKSTRTHDSVHNSPVMNGPTGDIGDDDVMDLQRTSFKAKRKQLTTETNPTSDSERKEFLENY